MPRVFLLKNCDDVDVESGANNDEEETNCRNDDDTNSGGVSDNLFSFWLFLSLRTLFLSIVDLSGEHCNLGDFLLLLSVILSTNDCEL